MCDLRIIVFHAQGAAVGGGSGTVRGEAGQGHHRLGQALDQGRPGGQDEAAVGEPKHRQWGTGDDHVDTWAVMTCVQRA